MSEGNKQLVSISSMSRRRFLSIVGSASAAAMLAACGTATTPAPSGGGTPAGTGAQTAPTAVPQVATGGGELTYLTWTNFVPEMDTALDKLGAEWGEKNKVTVKIEHININDIPTRRAAAVAARSGPDLMWDTQNWPVLFKDNLADVTEVVDELGKANGGWYDFTKQFANADGKWRSVPNSVGTGAFVHRTDLFKQNNVTAPKTWDEFMKAAATMKKAGKPFGQALGHSFGDPPGFWYPWLWSHGGKEVAEDGKTVIINSPETVSSLERAIELYKTGLVEAGIAWDDTSNNRSYLAEEISCTSNGSSIYFVMGQNAAKTPADEAAKRLFANSDHFAMPAGPKGTYTLGGLYSVGIMGYSKQINAAKDFMRWYMDPARFTSWLDSGKGYLVGAAKTFENAPVFKTDPKMKPFLENFVGDKVKWLGWPGPLSAAAYRVFNNQTIVDMYAKACIGEFNPKAAATWAEGQLKTVYK